jgi:lipopolysaccharide/colanic/teichoic acid biosynthesis glycosyltransferase
MKRALDVAVAASGLILLSPVLMLIAVAVKMDSPGPAIFSQERIGRNGRSFEILKFRTMIAAESPHRPNVSAVGDARITRVGRFLRAWFLDELPQLVNVLRGEMSLVGPRPETPEFIELLTAEERRILLVRPGITGPSSVTYSVREAELLAQQEDPNTYYSTVLVHDRAGADLTYVDTWSLLGDLRLLARTLRVILWR